MQPTASTLALEDISFSEQATKPEKQFKPGGFYQQIVSRLTRSVFNKDVIKNLGGKLVALADYAYTLRQIELIEQASHMLLKPPPLILSTETGRASSLIRWFDLLTITEILCVIAALNDTGGHCQGALTDLQNLLPLACAVGPQYSSLRCSYFNSLSGGPCEIGRVEEVQKSPEITLASPYASAYAELHEARKDITKKLYHTPRSFIAINQSSIEKENVLHLPVSGHKPGSAMPAEGGAKILYYTDWKNKMGKEPNGNENEQKTGQDMTGKEMIYRIINLFTHPETSEEKRLEMIRAIESIASRPDHKSDKDADKD
jgi:hypothetical protein